MSHRRVKSLAIDDDEFDDYDDYEDEEAATTEELSPEDKEQLRTGTINVREALGPSYTNVSEQEIHDALWNYYYDVAKSVTFLKNKHKPISAKPKPKASEPSHKTIPTRYSRPPSANDFFSDCPWLHIPRHRQADILVEPLYPRYGLLGGAPQEGKMSKLAALAAKRRQKENSQKTAETTLPNTEEYTMSLNKLNLDDSSHSSDKTKVEPQYQMDNNQAHAAELHIKDDLTSDDNINANYSTPEIPRAEPSAFASTILVPIPNYLYSNLNVQAGVQPVIFDFDVPSPDDVVNKAQTVKVNLPAKPKALTKAVSNVTNGVANLEVEEPNKIKSKNLDVLSEYKKIKRKNASNFIVIGHVDSGKSTLMGRLLFDLKAVDSRTMDKYKQESERVGKGSFAFAWVLDQGTDEREHGVTIDIGMNKFATDKTNFTILDAPGHKDFVPNMIAGASQADFAVLVIDASTGSFESGLRGQTKEHALLVRSLGVQRIIVAVNKMDSANWSQERFDEIKGQMSAFLTNAGFQAKNLAFVPCSGLEGGNILKKTTAPQASWYTGSTLVEELDKAEPINYSIDKPLRMTIGDVFRGSIQNPLSVSGRIEAGSLQIGEQLKIMPSTETAYVRSIEVDDEPADWAVAGQNVVLHLTDVDAINLHVGDVLCSPTSPIKIISTFKAKLLAFDYLTPSIVDLHRGRLHIPGRITKLVATLDKTSGAEMKKRPKIVHPGSVVRVLITLDQPVALEAPARIVLRADGESVAAGLIE